MKTWVKLYKDGDRMGIQTNATDAEKFLDELSYVLGEAMQSYRGDEAFQLHYWLPQAFEIVAQLRGYKTTATVMQVVSSGNVHGDVGAPAHQSETEKPKLEAVA